MAQWQPIPADGSFLDYRVPVPQQQDESKNTNEQAWKKLNQITPDSDENWEDSRKLLFNDAPGMIALVRQVLVPLLKHTPDFTIDASRRIGMIQRIILLAAVEVTLNTDAQDVKSFHDDVGRLLSQRLNKTLKMASIKKQTRAVKRLITVMDNLYKGKFRSRSFEAILLHAPLIPRYLEQYMNDVDRFTDRFCESKPLGKNLTEIQDSLPLYIPFFVFYLLSHREKLKPLCFSYNAVCEALNTSTYGIDEYKKFAKAVENKSSNRAAMSNEGGVPSWNTVHTEHTPSVHSKPFITLETRDMGQSTGRRFDPIQSITIQALDMNLAVRDCYQGSNNTSPSRSEIISFPTLHTSIGNYMVLAAPEELVRKAEEVGRSQTGKNITGNFSDEFYTYDWNNDLHDPVADQAIKNLVNLNIMKKGKNISRFKFSIYHASGGIVTPTGWFQVVLPTVKPDQPSRICITPQDTRVQVPVEWSLGSYFLLSEGTTLSPATPVSYISIAIPLMSRTSDS